MTDDQVTQLVYHLQLNQAETMQNRVILEWQLFVLVVIMVYTILGAIRKR